MARHCSAVSQCPEGIFPFFVFSLLRLVSPQVFKPDCRLSLEHQPRSVLSSVGLGDRGRDGRCQKDGTGAVKQRFLLLGRAAPVVWPVQSSLCCSLQPRVWVHLPVQVD